jgi:hypothetical protein
MNTIGSVSSMTDKLPPQIPRYIHPDRKTEDDRAESHFSVTARKAAEVNEGGLVDPEVP